MSCQGTALHCWVNCRAATRLQRRAGVLSSLDAHPTHFGLRTLSSHCPKAGGQQHQALDELLQPLRGALHAQHVSKILHDHHRQDDKGHQAAEVPHGQVDGGHLDCCCACWPIDGAAGSKRLVAVCFRMNCATMLHLVSCGEFVEQARCLGLHNPADKITRGPDPSQNLSEVHKKTHVS